MSFIGKEYQLDRNENYEAFVNQLSDQLSDEHKGMLLNLKPSIRVLQNGDEYTIVTTYAPGRSKEITFKSGVEFDENIRDSITAKSTVTVEGNTLIHVQNFSRASFTYKKVYTDSEMVSTDTSSRWDGVCKRYFKAA